MEDVRGNLPDRPVRFLDQFRFCIRQHGLAFKTEQVYVYWVSRFIRFHHLRHPDQLFERDVEMFLGDLSVSRGLSVSTQRLALNALVFLYRHLLDRPLKPLSFSVSSKPVKIPVVLTATEIVALFHELPRTPRLACRIIYGSGLRISECLGLRIQDLDFNRSLIIVRNGKGGKDRSTLLPKGLIEDIRLQIQICQLKHLQDIKDGFGSVYISTSLSNRDATAARSFAMQFLFPSYDLYPDPSSGEMKRHHISTRTVQRQLKAAAARANIDRSISVHSLRHTFATQLLDAGTDIRTIQELLGHSSLTTTQIYTQVTTQGRDKVESPIDALIKRPDK